MALCLRTARCIVRNRRLVSSASPAVAILFPGQGSQYVGMADKYLACPAARDVFKTARSILGYDLLKLCQEGPEDVLTLTYYCQPAVLATSIAALHWLNEQDTTILDRCVATAGFSVGELTALAFSEVVTLEDAFSIVRVRAKAMHDASIETPSGMMSVRGLPVSKIDELCRAAESLCSEQGGVAVIGNYLFPKAAAVSGTTDTLEVMARLVKESGGRCTPIKVAGAFHSPLMSGASEALRRVLVGSAVTEPRVPVYSNVTGCMNTSAFQCIDLFSDQLEMPVRWHSLVENMISDHGPSLEFHEVGPSRQISAMVCQIDRQMRGKMKATDS